MSNQLSAYSPLKIFHHPDILHKLKNKEYIAPIHVTLVPTNRCNQGCIGCAYRLKGYASNQRFTSTDEIPWGKLQEIVFACKKLGVQAIQLTGGGEPTLHPNFLNVCNLILSQDISLAVVTNGSIWSNQHSKILKHCKWVRFSIDAGTDYTYEQYRRTKRNSLCDVRRNLQELVAQNSDTIIGVGFVVNEYNWEEIFIAAKQAKCDGAHNFRISALFQNAGSRYFCGFYNQAKDLCYKAQELSDDNFKVFDLFGDRISDLDMASPDYEFCGMSKVSTYIGADQKVYTCCMNAYNQRGLIGDLTNQTFSDMWNSEDAQKKIMELDARKCNLCMYNNKNKTILYAIDDNPLHTEFV